jgi:hemoglobin
VRLAERGRPAAPGPADDFAWATPASMGRYRESADDVPEGLTIPRWSWDGLAD